MATIEGNEIRGLSGRGITLSAGSDATLTGNTIQDARTGIVVGGPNTSRLDSNVIEGATSRGLAIGGGSPVLTGNRVCDNATNLFLGDNATPDIDDSNEIFEDAPAG